jgi:hypothetical protein
VDLLGLLEADLGFRGFDFRREVGEWEGPLVLVQGDIAHDAISVRKHFVAKPLERFVVGAGNEKEDILEQDADLDDELENFEDDEKKDRIEKADGDICAFQEKGFHGAHGLSSFL